MSKWWCILCVFCGYYILLHISVLTPEKKTTFEMSYTASLVRNTQNLIFYVFGEIKIDENYLQIARNANKVQEIIPDNVPFPCNVTGGRSPKVPKSVHKLRPGDIDVIAAMGDSLTAGAGALATNVLQVIIENRGITATGGGQGTWREYLTLPNIIKEFNPDLIGYALGDSSTVDKISQLNVAISGATSVDTLYMAEILIEKMKNDPRIDLQRHWKLISLMIGTNNFCSEMCWISSPWSVLEKHKTDLLQLLRTLRDNLPRTFVALIPPPHMKLYVDSRKGRQSLICSFSLNIQCICMFSPAFHNSRPIYYEIMQRWQELYMEIAAHPEFQRDDFVVVAQPTLMDITVPLASDGYADMTYLSSDCFHYSQKCNARFANGLWNNLLEPVGAKTTTWDEIFHKFHCPTAERPYLATMLNS